METHIPGLDEILESVFDDESSTDIDDADNEASSPGDPIATSTPASPSTRATENREYCLIIFNNPRWSAALHRQHQRTAAQQQAANQYIPSTSSPSTGRTTTALDDQFIVQLKQLVKSYMQHTTRPFPVKYFINLTEK